MENEKLINDVKLIEQLVQTPIVNKVKMTKKANKNKSVVTVIPEVIEQEKSDEILDTPWSIETSTQYLLPYIYFMCITIFIITNVVNISTINLLLIIVMMCTGMLACFSYVKKVFEKIYTFSFSLQGLVSYLESKFKDKEPVVAAINLDIKAKLPFLNENENKKDTVELTSQDIKLSDTVCVQRGLTDIDLTTKKEKNLSYYHFKVMIKLGDEEPVLAEVDSDSQLSIISKDYFEKHIMNSSCYTFLPENPTSFGGIGAAGLIADTPPISVKYRIGGTILSGRFIVSNTLQSSPVLIGNDAILKYNISQVAVGGKKDKYGMGKWVLRIGFDPPSAEVPLFVTKKITNLSSPNVNKIELENDTDLEKNMESGLINKITDMETELNFIVNHKNIPEHGKEKLIKCLRGVPNLFSGEEYSEVSFPRSIFEHDIEFLPNAPTELYSKPFPVSGIRLAQLKENINDLVKK